MSLSNKYKRQLGWRSWSSIFDALPPLHGRTILDVGCGVGDQAAEIVARGARVIGIDMNEELLREAQSRQLPNAEFRIGDLRTFPDLGVVVDGLWCSFTAAYFPDLPVALVSWASYLRPRGWIALTEVDDLFGHEPLSVRTKGLFEGYARDALVAGRYDFHMGRKLRKHLEQSGFTVSKVLTLQDQELSFSGPAGSEVVDAWRTRFDRMALLRNFCGATFEQVREEFLGCLMRADHSSLAKVYCCIAIKPADV
jgi:SAM-dependent methyltransferase